MRYLNFSILLFVLISIAGCHNGSETANQNSIAEDRNDELMPKYAHGFQIIPKKEGKIIRIFDPWNKGKILQELYLYPKDNLPENKKQGAENVGIPVSSIAITSLDNVGFLGELGALNRVVAITDVNRLFNPYLQNSIEEEKIVNLGPAVDLNVEKLIMARPEVIFSTTYNSGSGEKDIFVKSGIVTFYNMDWMEQTPLGRAEWIKVIGALLDKEALADSIFSKIESDYLNIRQKIAETESRPEVIIGSNYKGIWYMPGGRSFKALLLHDAGASYYWAEDSSRGSLALSFEKVVELQSEAQVWLEAPYKSYEEILAVDSRYGIFTAYQDSMIFNNFGRSNGLANDYWEKGLCRPDLILLDLAEILHPELFEHKLLFYKKI